MASLTEAAPKQGAAKSREAEPVEFYRGIDPHLSGASSVAVTANAAGAPTVHHQCPAGQEWGAFAAGLTAGRQGAYIAASAFKNGSVSRFGGRTKANTVGSRAFWMDVEGEPGKAGGGYDGTHAARAAVMAFIRASRVEPNYLVQTGGAGLHLWFVLDEPLPVGAWLPRARALVELAGRHGLSIDAQCTTDPARVMRAPGSRHDKTGQLARAVTRRPTPYALAEFDKLTGFDGAVLADAGRRFLNSGINKLDVLDTAHRPPRSYVEAAKKCGAMRKAAEGRGAGASHNVWLCALATAKASVEGREFAHEISSGHAGYDEAKTDKKLDGLTGGPAGCDAWAKAFGKGGPCESCEWRAGR